MVVLEKDLRAMSIVTINSAKGSPAEVVNQLKDQLTTSLRVYEEKMGEILTQYNSNATDSVELASSSRPSGGSGASGSSSSNASTSGTTPSGSGGNVGGGNDLNTGGFSSNVVSHSQSSHVSERSYKLDPNTKKFNGKGDVRMWVFSVNEAMNVIKCPEDLKLSVILPYLEDLPLTFLFNYRVNNIEFNDCV